jgi:hypothetical protein
LLCEHHQLVTWLNERTLFAARSKRCSSITCIQAYVLCTVGGLDFVEKPRHVG